MLPPLKRTVLAQRDLSEQPASDYILIVGSGDRRGYYAIDSFEPGDGYMSFWKDTTKGNVLVYACKMDGSWNVISRDLLEQVTEEDVLREQEADRKAHESLAKELRPDVYAAIDKYNKKVMEEMSGDGKNTLEHPTHASGEPIGNYR